MENLQRFYAALLVFALAATSALALPARRVITVAGLQQSSGALERGYRTGYSDGYQAGYRDSVERASRDYRGKEDYRQANRAYSNAYGPLEDYRDGYQQGFEVGYADGYDHRNFHSDVPTGLARRQQTGAPDAYDNSATGNSNTGVNNGSASGGTGNSTGSYIPGPVYNIPANTVMTVELLTNLSTDVTQRGDRFQARVIEPLEYEGAMIDGRVTRVKRAGRVSGKSELQLTFDHIRFQDNRGANFEAQVVEVISGGGDGVGDVDPEGGVKGKDSTKDDVAKVGATTGVGAIIGAIAGGGKGAAIGAAIGGAIGTGGVLSSRGKDIRMPRGQQLRIRTSSQTRVQ